MFTELDLANTFLDTAETIMQGEIRKRNIANAEKAFDAITRFAPKALIESRDSKVFLWRAKRVIRHQLITLHWICLGPLIADGMPARAANG